MRHAVLVTTDSNRSYAVEAHHASLIAGVSLAMRVVLAAALLVVGTRMFSTLALLPIGWTLVSLAAAIVMSTFLQGANALHGADDEYDQTR